MDISLIITTYNWKEALGVSLTSVLAQTVSPCEVIVADDGSRPDTGELVCGSPPQPPSRSSTPGRRTGAFAWP